MVNTLTEKIDENTQKLADKNKILHKENSSLKDHITKIELNQLGNNVIIMGMQEQHWESYETTEECVYNTITAAMGGNMVSALEHARKVPITCCNRVGCYQLNKSRPTSITFECKEDKVNLLQSKQNLPSGVLVNEEYLTHLKRNCDVLQPILKLAKGLPDYRE